MKPGNKGPGEVLIEFTQSGNVVKATAVDPVTGIEASTIGPASAPRSVLAQAAIQKLAYVMKKKS